MQHALACRDCHSFICVHMQLALETARCHLHINVTDETNNSIAFEAQQLNFKALTVDLGTVRRMMLSNTQTQAGLTSC